MAAHDDCFKAVLHSGETHGKLEQLGGIDCYVSRPTDESTGNAALNNTLVCDSFADNGLLCILPDYLDGDAAPSGSAAWTDREAWFKRHGPEKTIPILDKVLAALEQEGITNLAAVGYCFGARETLHYATKRRFKCIAMAHPSKLRIPEDLERLAAAGTPVLINGAETDHSFPLEAQEQADEIWRGSSNYQRTFAKGCQHGFAIRGDLSDPAVKRGKEEAFRSQVQWFKKYL